MTQEAKPSKAGDLFDIWWESLDQKRRNELWPNLSDIVLAFYAGRDASHAGLREELNEERLAIEKIGEYLLPLVGTGDGTAVDAAKKAASELTGLREELERVKQDTEDLRREANVLIDYCEAHDWGMMPEPFDSINPLLKLLGR